MRKYILILCTCLIMLLFVYAGVAKLLDLNRFRHDMLNQPFPHWLGYTLVWAVPAIEIAVAVFLLFERTRLLGLWTAWCLLFMFTLYTFLILDNAFGRIPCSCGGMIRELSWKQHLYFNISFLVINSVAVVLQCQVKINKLFHAHGSGKTENL